MSVNLLRVQSNERVDLEDFQHAVDDSLQSFERQLVNEFLLDPDRANQFILENFAIDNPSGELVRVTLGQALLGQLDDGQTLQGHLVSSGEANRTVDVSTFADATYGIFVRLEYIDGTSQGRSFWSPTGSGSEFSQTIATRRLANWSMAIEIASPGTEWFQIGSVVVVSNAISTAAGGLVDTREFYFEGKKDADIAPATPADNGVQYRSGWSTDADPDGTHDDLPTASFAAVTWPGGSSYASSLTTADTSALNVGDYIRADSDGRWYKISFIDNSTDFFAQDIHGHGGWPSGSLASSLQLDRSPDRGNNGVSDLHTMLAALKQSIEDLKGRGINRWWDRHIAGMNVGFDEDPVDTVLAIGDADFNLAVDSSNPQITLDANDVLKYDRAGNALQFSVGGTKIFDLTGNRLQLATGGLSVGFAGSPSASEVSIGDNDFNLNFNGGDPEINFDTDVGLISRLRFSRSLNQFQFFIANISTAKVRPGGAEIPGGLIVGFTGTPQDDEIQVGDADFGLDYDGGTEPQIFFHSTDDVLSYNRSTDTYQFKINGSDVLTISDDGLNIATSPAPSSLVAGDVYFNTSGFHDQLKFYDGSRLTSLSPLVDRFETTNSSGTILSGADHSVTIHTFDESDVRQGSVVEVEVFGEVVDDTTTSYTIDLELSDGSVTRVVATEIVSAAGGNPFAYHIRAHVTFRDTPDALCQISYGGTCWVEKGGDPSVFNVVSDTSNTFDATGLSSFRLRVSAAGGDITDSHINHSTLKIF